MATGTNSTVVAVFRNRSDAQAAATELKSAGLSADDIYIGAGTGETGSSDARSGNYTQEHTDEGGITGWFKRVFGSEENYEDRPYYENAVNSGQVVLSVDTSDTNLDTVADILNRHSPVDVHREAGESAATTGSNAGQTRSTATAQSARVNTTNVNANQVRDQGQAIPVVEEQLKVGKRSIQRGGVRVYSRTISTPVEETVRLREERVTVDRQPVNRAVNASELREGRDQVIEVKEYAEEPVVSKQARVVEEVRVNKSATERAETVRDTVRHTEVKVENLGNEESGNGGRAGATGNFDEDFRRHFTTNYENTGGNYEDYAPAYNYGYKMANDPRYKGRDFSQVESDLRSDYARHYPNSTWERIKESVRYGWDKVTGRATAANASR